MIDLDEVVNDADLGEPFTILRNPGKFGAGGWVKSQQQTINTFGVVTIPSTKDLEMVPAGDRVHEIRMFHSTTPMFVTDEDKGITADIFVWNGVQYRAVANAERSNNNYYMVLAARMKGQ